MPLPQIGYAPPPRHESRVLRKNQPPHIHDHGDSRRIMVDVLLALAPAMLGSVYLFGTHVLAYYIIAMATAVVLDRVWWKFVRKRPRQFDWTPPVTGALLAMSLPADAPWWFAVLGAAVAIVVAKELFGGTGRNFLNPAITGRLVLRLLFVSRMTQNIWPRPGIPVPPGVDAVSGATPLMLVKEGIVPDEAVLAAEFFGNTGGKIGETSALLLLVGAAYLLWRKVIGWRIPVAMLGTMTAAAAIAAAAYGLFRETPVFILVHLLGGATMLGAFFMATDYASSPSTPKGQLIFGAGVGLITMAFRFFSSRSEGLTFALFLMNLLVPFLDTHTRPRVIGTGNAQK